MKKGLNWSFNIKLSCKSVVTCSQPSPNPAFPRTSMTPSLILPCLPPRARVQAVRHMSSPRGTGGSLGLLRCHRIQVISLRVQGTTSDSDRSCFLMFQLRLETTCIHLLWAQEPLAFLIKFIKFNSTQPPTQEQTEVSDD